MNRDASVIRMKKYCMKVFDQNLNQSGHFYIAIAGHPIIPDLFQRHHYTIQVLENILTALIAVNVSGGASQHI